MVFIVLVAAPVLFSIFCLFTDWNFLSGFEGIKWVGLSNFSDLLEDRTFIQAVGNTFIYTIATVPVSILIALILAYLLNEKVFLKNALAPLLFSSLIFPARLRWRLYLKYCFGKMGRLICSASMCCRWKLLRLGLRIPA